MPPAPNDLLTSLLRDVSRSFYLTMRVLPRAIRPQVSLAYLLARTTDTIADTELVPVSERLEALDQLRSRILGQSSARLSFSRFNQLEKSSVSKGVAEQSLLGRIEEALTILSGFSIEDQQRICEVLATITSGQELDLRRFEGNPRSPEGGTPNILTLRTDAELDDYTYRVAGCVGEFWTKMCRAHLFPRAPMDDNFFLTNGVRFGKGLQLVNVLRDLPMDLRKGRCYLPGNALTDAGLKPADLLNPANEPLLRPIYNRWLQTAGEHLAAGWAYTNALPRGQMRVRLACAWPILIGVKTLARLLEVNVLEPNQRVKISREEVKRIMIRSVVCYLLPGAWRNLFVSVGGAAAPPYQSR